MPYKKIIAASDFSEFGDQAISKAQSIAGDSKDLTLIHVMDPPALQDPLYAHYGLAVSSEQLEQAKEKALKLLQERYGEQNELRVQVGDATTEILTVAQEVGADLVVVSTHGRRGYSRFVFGSVCERIVRMSECDVLVVRSKKNA